MKVLKMKLFQETTCYKKPFAFKISETYPLPPYSTVNGMIHSILDADELIPMAISIQGDYEGIINNYQSTYFYKSNNVTSMPLNVHLLYNVNLIIHIKAEKAILDEIIEKISNNSEFLSLGRREDLVRIDQLKYVEVKEYDLEEDDEAEYEQIKIKNPIYIPEAKKPCELRGINYRLNWTYDLIDNIRNWKKINTLYVNPGDIINDGVIMLDEDEDLVFFNV